MPKTLKNQLRKLHMSTLSFYCITLAVICQAFLPISTVNAYTYTSNYTPFIGNLYFEEFEADYYLSKASDGTSRLKVVETFKAEFDDPKTSHGIVRIIPFTNQNGKNLTMASDSNLDIKIWRKGKEEKPYKIATDNGRFTVYIGSEHAYISGEQEYRLEYEFRNVITEFNKDGHAWQELYWDTNGNDWPQKFGQVTARVHFDDQSIAEAYQNQSWCYVGLYGENGQDRCTMTKIGDGVEFTAKNLKGYENLTYVLEFAADTFKVPEKTKDYHYVAVASIAGCIVVTFGLWFWCVQRKTSSKRKFYKDYFVKPEYAPPKGFTVGEMYYNYIGKGKNGSDKVATLMELAVQHKIELVQLGSDSQTSRKKKKWQINIKSVDLTPEEEVVLKILNGSNDSIHIGQEIIIKKHTADSALIKLGAKYNEDVLDSLLKSRLLESRKDKAGKLKAGKNPYDMLQLFSIVLAITGLFIALVSIPDSERSYIEMVGGVGLLVTTLVIFFSTMILFFCLSLRASRVTSHTEKGLEYSRYLEGLKLYITMAEKERLKFLQSVDGADVSHQGIVKVYEKLLPYAVMFKLEESWLKEMAKYYEYNDVATPVWYVGVGNFSASDFSSALTSASSYIASTATHSTTSNSSSGISGGGGGGFSGGGGGGGGGGSW